MSPQTPILLLKTQSTPHDGYHDFFTAQGYEPSFIPVLEHRYNTKNLAEVRHLFASGAFNLNKTAETPDQNSSKFTDGTKKKYGGMIFTSQRAVEGFAQMIKEEGLPCQFPSTDPLILYTVGPATARSLIALKDTYLPAATIYGADAGNGENLAHIILQHYNSHHPTSDSQNNSKPALLFLVGEQRRDIIPKMLMADSLPPQDRITVDEIVVYETGEMVSFEGDLQASVQGYKNESEIWVVVFSPSGCEGMLRVLKLGPFVTGDQGEGRWQRVFVATIGPTTRDHLREKFGFDADVCAEKPSPEGVAEGIRRFRESRHKT